MKVALLRVGIDTGSGGIHGPLFPDGSFEFIPIPDGFGIDERTYANTRGRSGTELIGFFPRSLQRCMSNQSMHVDPEFRTFTYGDPTRPKAGLRYLLPGDMLIFYCGLEGWGFESPPALYLVAYFDVQAAAIAQDFDSEQLGTLFSENFHVRHTSVYEHQKDRLVLVKGSTNSRRLNKAVPMSTVGYDRIGRPIKVLSSEMQEMFGSFGGKLSFQRSPPRWVEPDFTSRVVDYMRSLP